MRVALVILIAAGSAWAGAKIPDVHKLWDECHRATYNCNARLAVRADSLSAVANMCERVPSRSCKASVATQMRLQARTTRECKQIVAAACR